MLHNQTPKLSVSKTITAYLAHNSRGPQFSWAFLSLFLYILFLVSGSSFLLHLQRAAGLMGSGQFMVTLSEKSGVNGTSPHGLISRGGRIGLPTWHAFSLGKGRDEAYQWVSSVLGSELTLCHLCHKSKLCQSRFSR